jgi:hypothetical protein
MVGRMQVAALQAKLAEDQKMISQLLRENIALIKAAETAQDAKRSLSDCNDKLADTNLVRARLVLVVDIYTARPSYRLQQGPVQSRMETPCLIRRTGPCCLTLYRPLLFDVLQARVVLILDRALYLDVLQGQVMVLLYGDLVSFCTSPCCFS